MWQHHRGFGVSAFAMMVLSGLIAAQSAVVSERFRAFALDRAGGGTAAVDMTVTRWSTAGEASQLSVAFNDAGMEGLLRQLRRMPRAGFVRVDAGLGIPVHFAQLAREANGTQRLMFLAIRNMSSYEVGTLAPSMNYPLMVTELRLDARGEGTGTMWPVAAITYWDSATQTVVIDNQTQQPLDLMAVRWQHGATD